MDVAAKETKPAAAVAPLGLLKALAAVLIALKLVLMGTGGTFQDEAYYWMWGQHPALSYYDHPPLNAWLQGVSGAVFGWNRFATRLPVALALAGDVLVLWLFARRLAPGSRDGYFWTSLVLFLATPIFFAITAVALPDHLLLACGLVSFYCFYAFFEEWRPGTRTSYRMLYLGALFLGLATLAKYNAAFLGLGVALFILLTPRYRPLLLRPQLYLAAGLSLALQVPVVLWNLQQGFASYGFIIGGRHQGLLASFDGIVGFVRGVLIFLLPFLLVPIVKFLFARRGQGSAADGLGRMLFAVSTLSILVLSFFTNVLFHWNLVAYMGVLPFLARHLRSRLLFWAQALTGAVFLAAMIVNYAVVPVTDVRAIQDEASAWAYGWDQTAAAVRAARDAHGAAFVAASDYTIASLLGYALRDKDVTSLSPRRDQFDYWFDRQAHAGADAIVVVDNWRGLGGIETQFETMTLLEDLPVERFGKPLDVHQIYLAKGFKP